MRAMRRIREPRRPWRVRLGMRIWGLLHRLATGWPCRRCRPHMQVWMEGFHDATNVRLGKPVFRAVSFGRFAGGELDGGYHRACLGCRLLRMSLRLVSRTPWDQAQVPPGSARPKAARAGIGNGIREEDP